MKRALIIQSETLLLDDLKRLLNSSKFIVKTTNSGLEALRMISTQQFEMVIIDLLTPDFDGNDLAMHIRLMKTPPPLVVGLSEGTHLLRKDVFDRIIGSPVSAYDIVQVLNCYDKKVDIPFPKKAIILSYPNYAENGLIDKIVKEAV